MNRTILASLAMSLALLAVPLAARAASPLDDPALIESKLQTALDDEYHARAFYAAVLSEFGEVRPFSRIIRAEERHIEALLRLYDRYGLTAPDDPYAEASFEFADLEDAARQARDAELANAELYDELLADVTDEQVRFVFERLQYASLERHLPALERYLEGGCPAAGPGAGRGDGGGRGMGRGGPGR